MEKAFNIPPKDSSKVMNSKQLTSCLKCLIGKPIKITGKPRTDGSTARKLVKDCLSKSSTCVAANSTEYKIIPKRGKGIPRLLLELVDTYVVTSGKDYNLQIWNRIPNSKSTLIEYCNGDKIRSCDIRLILLKIDLAKSKIESIIILTPSYVVKNFGLFGKPTIKHQIIISEKKRAEIKGKVLLGTDTKRMVDICGKTYLRPTEVMNVFPNVSKPFCITILNDQVAKKLIGEKLKPSATKTRGQILESLTMKLLGYNGSLVGNYPDIPNQYLEVKVQDSPTVDLGKYSPEFEEIINSCITTRDIRYLIALTDSATNLIEGVVLVSGEELGNHFTFVSDKSFKCQRTIPMSFFDKYSGKCVFNP